jgi:hypothetical protein
MQVEGKTLSERIGLTRFVRDLRYNRHRTRQLVGISFLILLTIVGVPTYADIYFLGVAVATLGIAVRMWASGHVKKDKMLATTGRTRTCAIRSTSAIILFFRVLFGLGPMVELLCGLHSSSFTIPRPSPTRINCSPDFSRKIGRPGAETRADPAAQAVSFRPKLGMVV